MPKPRSTRTVVSRSAAPIGISGKAQETHKGGFPTGLDVDNLRLPPSTRSKPPSLKDSPKKETVVRLLKQEEDEQQLNLCVGERVQFTGNISGDLLMYARWFTEQLCNDGFEEYHKNGKEKLDAMKQRALTRPKTRSMARVMDAPSISEHTNLEEILDTIIQQARDPHRPSPERLPSSNREIVNQRILSTCRLLEGDPDSAMKLFGNICAAGSKDPTKEWLLSLSIPCSVIHKKSTPRNSDHSLFENAEELSEDEGEQRRRSSSMTLIHMKKCGWDFYDKLPEVDSKRTPAATANKKAQRPLQDVTVRSREPRGPRESGRDGRSLGIHFNLIIEIRTQLKQLSLSTLNLPERWKFIGQMNERLPQLVLPDEYKRALGKADRRVSGSKIHEISKSQVTSPVSSIKKPLSVQRDHLSQSSPSEEPVQQSDLEKYLYQSLRERFPLTGQRLRDDFQAKEVEKAIEGWNAMPRHLNLTIDLYRALAQLGALEKVVWLSDREMVQQDSMHRSGNPTINERIYGGTILEQDMIRNFLVYRSPRNALSEGEVESGSGAVLQKVIAGEGITDKRNCQLRVPEHLRPSGACPNPDIYVRIDFEDQLGWHDDLKPIIFAGECKTEKTRSRNTPAQLAVAFHATLIILIFYYLDNRSSASDPLPAWLFLYGIEYTEHGFFVHVHFPYYNFDGPNPGWGFVSAKFTDEFSKVFKNGDTDLRLSALALLFRMRSQAMFVMEKLKEWKRAPRVLSVLQRQAAAPDSLARASGESPKRKKGPRVTL